MHKVPLKLLVKQHRRLKNNQLTSSLSICSTAQKRLASTSPKCHKNYKACQLEQSMNCEVTQPCICFNPAVAKTSLISVSGVLRSEGQDGSSCRNTSEYISIMKLDALFVRPSDEWMH